MGQPELRVIPWSTLKAFQNEQASLCRRDTDVVLNLNIECMYHATPYGIYVDGELVGIARLREETNHLRSLYVTPRYRGRGLASFVLEALKVRSLRVKTQNAVALATYLKAGFSIGPYPVIAERYFMVRTVDGRQADEPAM